jgi:putative Holliday junction resolvase
VAALVEAGVGRRARRDKGRVDAAAAAVILQDYLDDLRADGR